MVKKKSKKEQDHDFYYEGGRVHLYEADAFISQIKHMMRDVIPDVDFAVYLGVNDRDCIDVWVRDENETMYQIEPKNLDNEESEIRLREVDNEGDDEDE